MEYGRCQNGMEWKISRMEWKTIFHTSILDLCIVFTEKCTPMSCSDHNIVTEVFNFNVYAYILVDKSQYFGSVHCANSVLIASLLVNCNLIAALMLQLTTLIDLSCCFFFVLRLTICPVVNFVFLHRHKNSYLLYHPRFSLILCIFLVFMLIVILFGVKVWYFCYGKCSS